MKREYLRIITVMIAIAALFGSVVSGIYIGSRETLARNRAIRLQRAYVEVFDYGDPDVLSDEEITRIVDTRIDATLDPLTDPESGERITFIKAYENAQHSELKGIGFRFNGLGFWAPIEGILALTPDLQKTLDIFILRQQETPGLGGRIEEDIFTGAFEDGLDVSKPQKGSKWIEISTTPPPSDSPLKSRHVDAITGATQTCIAMERILNQELARFHRAINAGTETRPR